MIGLACALVSGGAFFLSLGPGDLGLLAWIAPVPALWYALGAPRLAPAAAVAFGSFALGATNLLGAYLGALPPVVLALAIGGPSLLFMVAVVAARAVARDIGPLAGALAFACLWAGLDFLKSLDMAGGGALTPAASQTATPALMQAAAVFGFAGVTFLIGLTAASLAAGLARRRPVLLGFAAAVFLINMGLGAWRIAAAPGGRAFHVALLSGDGAEGAVLGLDRARAQAAVDRYVQAMHALRPPLDLILLPENIARLDGSWRGQVLAPLARAGRSRGALLIAGFNARFQGAQRNLAWVADATGSETFYAKRQLVPGLETPRYRPGSGPVAKGAVLVEICRDLDFPEMIRSDVAATRPRLIAAPAWDFGADGWSHARIAILRGVENGVAVARSARSGVVTLTDRYGRLVASGVSGEPITTVVADVFLPDAPVPTPYAAGGSLFGWICLVLGVALRLVAWRRRRA